MTTPDAQTVVRVTADPAAFREVVAPLIEREPVQHSVLATNLARVLAADDPAGEALWIWAELRGRPVAAALHTPPHPPYLCTSDPAVAVAMAEELSRSTRAVDGVNGSRGASEAFARRWCELHRCRASIEGETAVYVLDRVVHPTGVPGRLRLAEHSDADLLNEWARDFTAAVGEPASTEQNPMTARIDDRELWVWDDGGPVSMAYASPAHGGVSRIAWVYTPPGLRTRGYASACVAGVSQEQVGRGDACMLYADLADPKSNAIYQVIGYRRVGDAVHLRFQAVP